MNKSLAIAVSLCLVTMAVCEVEAGLFGRRSGCQGGNCYRSFAPTYTRTVTTVQKPSIAYKSATAAPGEAKPPAVQAKPVVRRQQENGVQSPSDIPVQEAPAASRSSAPRVIYSSPCANGRCGTTYYYRGRGR